MADNQRKDRERQGLVFRVEWNGPVYRGGKVAPRFIKLVSTACWTVAK